MYIFSSAPTGDIRKISNLTELDASGCGHSYLIGLACSSLFVLFAELLTFLET